jgi:hypothetical protein
MDSTKPAMPDLISANLRLILRGVLAAMGMWRLEAALAVLLYRRIGPLIGRIERMLARFRAGRLRRMTPRPQGARRKALEKAAVALPRRFGWLVQAGGHQAAGFGSQLQTLLNTPEMIALVAASPQAGRQLRPLCRALAVELPGYPERPRQTAIRRRRARAKPEPFRIPLPRGVISAARRQGFGKLC